MRDEQRRAAKACARNLMHLQPHGGAALLGRAHLGLEITALAAARLLGRPRAPRAEADRPEPLVAP